MRSGGARFRAAGPLGFAVLALGLAGAVVLVVAETQPVVTIEILTGGSCEILADQTLRDLCSQSGASRHSYGLLLLGLLAGVMAVGAGAGRSRPAAVALALAGAAALAVVLIGDLPEVNETGEIGLQFAEAEARAGSGFYLSLLGGGLALAGGVVGVLATLRS